MDELSNEQVRAFIEQITDALLRAVLLNLVMRVEQLEASAAPYFTD